MQLIEWSPVFELGLQLIDEQHRRLVDLTNKFGGLLSKNEVDRPALEEVFVELLGYTEYHFREEEELMAKMGVDPRHVELHEQQHRTFLNDVAAFHREMPRDGDNARALFEYLMNWLVYHILGSDRSMGRQIGLICDEVSPQQAYARHEEAIDGAAGMLLNSLNNLFQQVSLRNRQLSELNQSLENKVAERTRELSAANIRLGELASTDALTGLANRRHALQQLQQLWDETEAVEQLSCMMIDADGFKQINDRFGHDAGDEVLRELARYLCHLVRTDDIVCRLGGDEFLILCPATDADGAQQVARQVHAGVAAQRITFPGGAWAGSISVGVATRTEEMTGPGDLIKAADQGVYAAKEAGRNCVRWVE